MKHKSKEKQPDKTDAEELRRQLENLQKEKDELFGQLQRVSADYANFQKRSVKQASDTIAYEKELIIKTLLPAIDNFEHTLQNAHSAENTDVLIKAIEIIYQQMLDVLKLHNVEQIKALGEKFDPHKHQAMMTVESKQPPNTVVTVYQKGYLLNDRILRPALVAVAKAPTSEDAAASS